MCTYCAQFVDPDFAQKFITAPTAASAHSSFLLDAQNEGNSPKPAREASISADLGSDLKHHDLAIMKIAQEMKKNENIAKFEEIKINTEVMLGVF